MLSSSQGMKCPPQTPIRSTSDIPRKLTWAAALHKFRNFAVLGAMLQTVNFPLVGVGRFRPESRPQITTLRSTGCEARETHHAARTRPGEVHFICRIHHRWCRRCGNLGDAADAADADPDAVSDTVQALDLPAGAYAAVGREFGGRVRAGLARFWAQQELQGEVDQAVPEQQLLRCCCVCRKKTKRVREVGMASEMGWCMVCS